MLNWRFNLIPQLRIFITFWDHLERVKKLNLYSNKRFRVELLTDLIKIILLFSMWWALMKTRWRHRKPFYKSPTFICLHYFEELKNWEEKQVETKTMEANF